MLSWHCSRRSQEAELHQQLLQLLHRRGRSCRLLRPRRPSFTRRPFDFRFCRGTVLCDPKRPSGRASATDSATAATSGVLVVPPALDPSDLASPGDTAKTDSVKALSLAISGGRASTAGFATAVAARLARSHNGPGQPLHHPPQLLHLVYELKDIVAWSFASHQQRRRYLPSRVAKKQQRR